MAEKARCQNHQKSLWKREESLPLKRVTGQKETKKKRIGKMQRKEKEKGMNLKSQGETQKQIEEHLGRHQWIEMKQTLKVLLLKGKELTQRETLGKGLRLFLEKKDISTVFSQGKKEMTGNQIAEEITNTGPQSLRGQEI